MIMRKNESRPSPGVQGPEGAILSSAILIIIAIK